MKSVIRTICARILAMLATAIVRKYQPKIVMITGSVGKTSTKDAVAKALSTSFKLRASEKSFNSEFGVPLTIIGAKNPWNNPLKWLSVFEEGITLLLFKGHYPELLVLEVGADKPGDLTNILTIVTPDVVVVTRLPDVPVHVEAYENPEAVREEEFLPARALSPEGILVYCADDAHTKQLAESLSVNSYTYGMSADATVRIVSQTIVYDTARLSGMNCAFVVDDTDVLVFVSGVLGYAQGPILGAALTCARAFSIQLEEVKRALSSYVPPPGRSRILSGIRETTLIDDSYNASPEAVHMALSFLKEMKIQGKKIAVLGDMLELGRHSVSEHEHVGTLVPDSVDILICVGVRSQSIAESAKKCGFSDGAIYTVSKSEEAIPLLRDLLQEGDIVLIKGSQSMRMEKIVKALLKDPKDSSHLVRQEREWLIKK